MNMDKMVINYISLCTTTINNHKEYELLIKKEKIITFVILMRGLLLIQEKTGHS